MRVNALGSNPFMKHHFSVPYLFDDDEDGILKEGKGLQMMQKILDNMCMSCVSGKEVRAKLTEFSIWLGIPQGDQLSLCIYPDYRKMACLHLNHCHANGPLAPIDKQLHGPLAHKHTTTYFPVLFAYFALLS